MCIHQLYLYLWSHLLDALQRVTGSMTMQLKICVQAQLFIYCAVTLTFFGEHVFIWTRSNSSSSSSSSSKLRPRAQSGDTQTKGQHSFTERGGFHAVRIYAELVCICRLVWPERCNHWSAWFIAINIITDHREQIWVIHWSFLLLCCIFNRRWIKYACHCQTEIGSK